MPDMYAIGHKVNWLRSGYGYHFNIAGIVVKPGPLRTTISVFNIQNGSFEKKSILNKNLSDRDNHISGFDDTNITQEVTNV